MLYIIEFIDSGYQIIYENIFYLLYSLIKEIKIKIILYTL